MLCGLTNVNTIFASFQQCLRCLYHCLLCDDGLLQCFPTVKYVERFAILEKYMSVYKYVSSVNLFVMWPFPHRLRFEGSHILWPLLIYILRSRN